MNEIWLVNGMIDGEGRILEAYTTYYAALDRAVSVWGTDDMEQMQDHTTFNTNSPMSGGELTRVEVRR